MSFNYTSIIQYSLAMLSLAISFQIAAGPFAPAPPPAPEPIDNGSTAIPAKSLSIVAWAQGYENYFPGSHVDPPFQTPEKALLEAGNSDGNNTGHMFDIVSLGRGGSITLLFNPPIRNGEGYDFAVFENSFSGDFLELAWVEVSSNGVDFFRFYNISLTESDVGGFGIIDPTNVTGLAGKYEQGFGTPFDLQQLTLTHSNLNNLDLNRISHVKIIDIVGDGFHYDSITSGNGPNPIYDPYPTWSSAGFDLDAVAALYITEALYEENVPIPPLFSSLLSLLILLINQLSRSFQSPKKHKSLEF